MGGNGSSRSLIGSTPSAAKELTGCVDAAGLTAIPCSTTAVHSALGGKPDEARPANKLSFKMPNKLLHKHFLIAGMTHSTSNCSLV